MSSHELTVDGRPRARALGFEFDGVPGATNSLTEVHGVEVGVKTIISGDSVRTGVTAIHPRGKGQVTDPIAAGFHSQNRNGEMTGVSWISESGTFSGPVVISNTHNAGVAHAGVVAWTVKHHCEVAEVRLLPIVGETWNGYLIDHEVCQSSDCHSHVRNRLRNTTLNLYQQTPQSMRSRCQAGHESPLSVVRSQEPIRALHKTDNRQGGRIMIITRVIKEFFGDHRDATSAKSARSTD